MVDNSEITEEDMIKAFKTFALDLAQRQIELDPEFQKVLDEHFWELIETD